MPGRRRSTLHHEITFRYISSLSISKSIPSRTQPSIDNNIIIILLPALLLPYTQINTHIPKHTTSINMSGQLTVYDKTGKQVVSTNQAGISQHENHCAISYKDGVGKKAFCYIGPANSKVARKALGIADRMDQYTWSRSLE
jgi:hypothetical protein